jgi:hypothetical protein
MKPGPRPASPEIAQHRPGVQKNPSRLMERENPPIGIPPIGDAPKCLTPAQRECWNTIVDSCADGVLRRSDELVVEMAARLLAESRAGTIDRSGLKLLETLLSKCGMNPSDRNRVNVPAERKPNRFDVSEKHP